MKLNNDYLEKEFKDKDYNNTDYANYLFEVNKIRAIKIFNTRHENEDYKNLVQFIKNKEKEELRISEFLLQFYIEKILNLKEGKKNVEFCKDIIKHLSLNMSENNIKQKAKNINTKLGSKNIDEAIRIFENTYFKLSE